MTFRKNPRMLYIWRYHQVVIMSWGWGRMGRDTGWTRTAVGAGGLQLGSSGGRGGINNTDTAFHQFHSQISHPPTVGGRGHGEAAGSGRPPVTAPARRSFGTPNVSLIRSPGGGGRGGGGSGKGGGSRRGGGGPRGLLAHVRNNLSCTCCKENCCKENCR